MVKKIRKSLSKSGKCPKICPKHVRKYSKNVRKHVPNMSENVRKISENMSQTSPKMSEKCPKMCPGHTPKSSEISQKYDKKSLSVAPGIEPGTLRIRLQPLSVSNPIGLIPSQQIGSPWISYVSELETEKVTWAFSKLKKTLF